MNTGSGGKRALRVLLGTLFLLFLVFALLLRAGYKDSSRGAPASLSELYGFAARGEIVEAKFLDEDARIVGRRCLVNTGPPARPNDRSGEPSPCAGESRTFHVDYPASDVSTQQLIDRITVSEAPVLIDKQTEKAVIKLIATFLIPLLILANLFGLIFVSRAGESSMSDVIGFGAIGAKRRRKKHAETEVSFEDVAGADEAVAELREVTDYLTSPEKYEAYGALAPKGVLLFGPPGCGKTLLARATAGESQVPFFSVSGTEFVESLVGVGAARVRDLFRQVREEAPAIVFVDEIDAVGRRRSGEGMSGGEREQTLNQLLVEMDGFEVSSGIVLMGATNRPDILDPALMRPGRFDRHIVLQPPDIHGRRSILELHAKDRPVEAGVDFDYLARRTPGFTGADLANVINEAALLAIREGTEVIGTSHLSEAIQRVRQGPQRRGQIMSASERRRLAFHESGHAVVSAAMGQATGVDRVSIVARGRGVAQASVVTEEADRVLLTTSEIEAQLTMTMGGVAAEVLHFGESSTTAADDVERATCLAREMVGLYGMSEEVGRLKLWGGNEGFLGDGAALEAVSDLTMVDFDKEVKRLVKEAEQRATAVLSRHHDALSTMAERLVEEETLEGQPLESLLGAIPSEVERFFPNRVQRDGAKARKTTGSRKTSASR